MRQYQPKSVYTVHASFTAVLAIRAMLPLTVADDGVSARAANPGESEGWSHYGTVPNRLTLERVETMAQTLKAIIDR